MTSKSIKHRKPARTIDEQIADLKAKADAQRERKRERFATKIEHATEQHKAALIKADAIEAYLNTLMEQYKELFGNEPSPVYPGKLPVKEPVDEPAEDNTAETSGE